MSASLASECNEAKERYDACFLKWYSEKFLRGTASSPASSSPRSVRTPGSTLTSTTTETTGEQSASSGSAECDPLFRAYNTCLWRALREKGIDSMVEEARGEAKETDEEHMRAPAALRGR